MNGSGRHLPSSGVTDSRSTDPIRRDERISIRYDRGRSSCRRRKNALDTCGTPVLRRSPRIICPSQVDGIFLRSSAPLQAPPKIPVSGHRPSETESRDFVSIRRGNCVRFCGALVRVPFRFFRFFRGPETAKLCRKHRVLLMAGELGFEPRLTESESAVLPLNYSPMVRQIAVKSGLFKRDKSDV